MRGWDGLNDDGREWWPCEHHKSCIKFEDRFATSIIYHPHGQTYAAGGFVIRPSQISLNCAYPADGGSQSALCHPPGRSSTCMPGCKRWCDPAKGVRNWGCSWPAENLKEMLVEQRFNSPYGGYNEGILDAATWKQNLPHTIEAVFIRSEAPERDRTYATAVHTAFLKEYSISSQEAPLLEYNASHTFAPFRVLL